MAQTTTTEQPRKPEKFYRLREVESLFSIRKTSIYAGMKAGTFPRAFQLSTRAVAWKESDLLAWQAQRAQALGAKP